MCYAFISKVKQSFLIASDRSGCFEFLVWFSSTALLIRMKSLFFTLSTSPNVTNLCVDYGRKYELAYNFKYFR